MPLTNKTTAEQVIQELQTDLHGKVAIVTGCNSGIGLETSRVLSLAGAKVILPCRTLTRAQEAIRHIQKTVPNADLVPMQLDLSEFASIHTFVTSFLALDLPLDILINNAGTILSHKQFTVDGYETIFAVNHLAHFLLVNLLVDKLESTSSRVVIVSSSGQAQFLPETGMDFENLNSEKYFSPMAAYVQSKLANIYHAKELQRQLKNVSVCCLHPGLIVKTNIGRQFSYSALWDLMCRLRWNKIEWGASKSIEQGASTIVYCAVVPDLEKGGYYINHQVTTEYLNEQADNIELQKKLWDISMDMTMNSKVM